MEFLSHMCSYFFIAISTCLHELYPADSCLFVIRFMWLHIVSILPYPFLIGYQLFFKILHNLLMGRHFCGGGHFILTESKAILRARIG